MKYVPVYVRFIFNPFARLAFQLGLSQQITFEIVNREDSDLCIWMPSIEDENEKDYPECLAGFHPAEDDERYSEG